MAKVIQDVLGNKKALPQLERFLGLKLIPSFEQTSLSHWVYWSAF